ncbi:MAG: SBBP repeat-containing protein [Candidatus Hodarchaeales archaeon]|jgi:hypothetical protein
MGERHHKRKVILVTVSLILNLGILFCIGIISDSSRYSIDSVKGVEEEDELRMKYIFSRVLGGGKEDVGEGIGIDSQERIVITGNTETAGFPVLNAYDSSYNGPSEIYFEGDAFIASFYPNGTLYWSTYFGGSQSDFGADLVIDSQDNIIITGSTDSTDFPVLNADDSSHNGNEDAFLAKFTSNGELLWSTFVGDIGHEFGMGVALDSSDNIFVTGRWEVPPIGNYYWDAYVAKYSPNGVFQWIQTLGGNQLDYGMGITIDKQDNVVITGITSSSDFPNDNVYQGNQQEIFVAKLNTSGDLVWSNVVGGGENDFCRSVQTDVEDNIILAGWTFSSDYPTVNAEDSLFDGSEDIIISKFDPNGSMLWSTYLGGSHNDMTEKIHVDDVGNIYVSGETLSMDYPLTNTSQSHLLSDSFQAFLTILNPEGFILWSETFGATQGNYISDRGKALVVDSKKNVMIVGSTSSKYFPVTTNDVYTDDADVFICSLYNPFEERPLMPTSTEPIATETDDSTTETETTVNLTDGFSVFIVLVIFLIPLWKKR